MGVARKWVFPILRLVVFAAIAIALVKVAFFADTAPVDDPASPTGEITNPQVAVALGTITNDVTLDGTVTADAAVPVRATAAGTVDDIFVAQGATVAAGDALFDIKVETPRDPVETTADDGTVTVTQPKPTVSFTKVFAPIGGVLSSLTVLHGQALSVGDASGNVAPPTFSVTGSLTAEQQYRLLTQPTEASVAITGGPAPFTCTGLTITSALAGSSDSGAGTGAGATDGGGGATSGTSVRCAVPGDVRVFPGLAAKLTLAAGKAENVLVVPTTAVEGSSATGNVWFVLDDGSTEQRPVTLGLSDGTSVQVVDGLAEGDSILQFVPGAPAVTDDPCSQPGVMCGMGG